MRTFLLLLFQQVPKDNRKGKPDAPPESLPGHLSDPPMHNWDLNHSAGPGNLKDITLVQYIFVTGVVYLGKLIISHLELTLCVIQATRPWEEKYQEIPYQGLNPPVRRFLKQKE